MNRRALLKGLIAGGAAATVARPSHATEAKAPPSDAVGMLYDATRCIGCKSCVVACREANDSPPSRDAADHGLHDMQTELNATTKNVIKLYQEPAQGGQPAVQSYMKQQCMHCVDPACVSVCMIGALKKREFGIVTYNKDLCVGCRYCQMACPYNVPKFEWSKATPKIVKCEMCVDRLVKGLKPACVEVCPRQAIVFGKLEELKAEGHRRLKESPKRYVPKLYGEHDGGGTQVLYLAAVPFEKLGLPHLGDEAVPHLSETIQHGIYKGFIAPIALYAAFAGTVLKNRLKKDGEPEATDKKEES